MTERTIDEIYGAPQSGFWKGEDLHGEDWELIISGAEEKLMDSTDWDNPSGPKLKKVKVVLTFAGSDKALPLNATNARAIEAAYGHFHSRWIGKPIILFEGEWQNKPVVRVRVPKVLKKAAPPRNSENPADGMPGDEIPF